jgi:uncharacterized protein GlcG (DUF336 family)
MSDFISQSTIKYEAALRILRGAVDEAAALGIKINVAVTDSGGNLAGFLRMPGAFLHSIDIAIDKAYTASSFGFPTSQWMGLIENDQPLREGLVQRPRLVIFGGGVPIRVNGELAGGVGVSGGSAEEDERCAMAGISQLSL